MEKSKKIDEEIKKISGKIGVSKNTLERIATIIFLEKNFEYIVGSSVGTSEPTNPLINEDGKK